MTRRYQRYDHDLIATLRADGCTWREVCVAIGMDPADEKRVAHAHQAHKGFGLPHDKLRHQHTLPGLDLSAIEHSDVLTATFTTPPRNAAEVLAALGMNEEEYEIVREWIKTDVRSSGEVVYTVSAFVKPRSQQQTPAFAKEVWEALKYDAQRYTPVYESVHDYQPNHEPAMLAGEPCMALIAIQDPHLGMRAWGAECGVDYDLAIGVEDYRRASKNLLGNLKAYPIEAIRYVVGNDLFHADTLAEGGKGATTTKGTMQDIDTRLSKIFTSVRRAVVGAIDEARLIAPVKIMCVPGNHDQETMYKFAEVLHAWYRSDPEVVVDYGPSKRRYDLYGNTVFLYTHGEEFKRKRDNLVSVFATECPAELWAAAKYREAIVGHNHINMQKVYTGDPVEVEWEGRATRVRSLPGLTPEDTWHYGEGYKHTRAATAIIYRRSGGVAGLHEFVL